jgi:hypothetical protein
MRDYDSLFKDLLEDLACPEASSSIDYITSDMTDVAIAKWQLARSFYKKLCVNGNTDKADSAALEKFKAVNLSLPEHTFVFESENEVESCFWDYFKDNLNCALDPFQSGLVFDFEFIREHMTIGPGASQLANPENFATKLFDGEVSYTSEDLITWYRTALVGTGFWADAEMHRFQKFGFTKVRGGKIFFASKNAEISRTCCTEPNLNLLIQTAIRDFLELCAQRHFGINLSTQPQVNRRLAGLGSVTGSFGTSDLVSASDSIGLHMLNAALRDSFLKRAIMASRCASAVLPDGTEMQLRMISTMGNGFTFPLQTVIFASVVKSCYQLKGIPFNCRDHNFSVFGDDIVVRKDCFDFVNKMLGKLGFTVNQGKSFNTGLFRESCGHDYYNGLNVRGVYIKSLETPPEVYSAINRLARWSAYHGVPLCRTITRLRSWSSDMLVPPSEADDAGIKVPFKLTRPKLTSDYWFKYRAAKRISRRVTVPEPDCEEPRISYTSPLGVGLAILGGYIRRRDFAYTKTDDSPWKHDWSLSASIRDRVGARPRYKIVTKTIPYWDYWPAEKPEFLIEDSLGRTELTLSSQRIWEDTLVALFKSE